MARQIREVESEIKSLQFMAKNSGYGHGANLSAIQDRIAADLDELRILHGGTLIKQFVRYATGTSFQVMTGPDATDAEGVALALAASQCGTIAAFVRTGEGAYHLTIRNSLCSDHVDFRRSLIVREYPGFAQNRTFPRAPPHFLRERSTRPSGRVRIETHLVIFLRPDP